MRQKLLELAQFARCHKLLSTFLTANGLILSGILLLFSAHSIAWPPHSPDYFDEPYSHMARLDTHLKFLAYYLGAVGTALQFLAIYRWLKIDHKPGNR